MSASDIKGGWADDVPVGLHTCVVIVKYADTHSEFDWRGRHTGPLYRVSEWSAGCRRRRTIKRYRHQSMSSPCLGNLKWIGLLIPGTERVEIFDIFDIQRWYLFSLISRVSCKVTIPGAEPQTAQEKFRYRSTLRSAYLRNFQASDSTYS